MVAEKRVGDKVGGEKYCCCAGHRHEHFAGGCRPDKDAVPCEGEKSRYGDGDDPIHIFPGVGHDFVIVAQQSEQQVTADSIDDGKYHGKEQSPTAYFDDAFREPGLVACADVFLSKGLA